ncbi:hypothetical protein AADZ90_021395 [Aestuariibius sp. 2305UL40-4]|uniref:hypothetical protein n=1 Tax=Aestuariibius violaceus TaxID=3234132 RepID=UPI00345ED5E3
MPTWPATVPCRFRVPSLTETGPIGNLIETPTSAGPSKKRRRFTAAIRQIEFTTGQLTLAQADTFEAWFENDLADGALSFDMKHPRTRDLRRWQFSVGAQKYAIAHLSGSLYSISFTLDLLP